MRRRRAPGWFGSEAGATLIETLAVVAIISILTAIAVPMMLTERTKGWESAVLGELNTLALAEEVRHQDSGRYTTDLATLTDLGYRRNNEIVLTWNATADGASYGACGQHTAGGGKFRVSAGGRPEKLPPRSTAC